MQRGHLIGSLSQGYGGSDDSQEGAADAANAQSDVVENLKEELAQMEQEEALIDGSIQTVQDMLLELGNDKHCKEMAYITHQDVRKISCFLEDTLLAVKAPFGSTLEVPDPDEGMPLGHRRYEIQLTSPSGAIDVFLIQDGPFVADLGPIAADKFESSSIITYKEDLYQCERPETSSTSRPINEATNSHTDTEDGPLPELHAQKNFHSTSDLCEARIFAYDLENSPKSTDSPADRFKPTAPNDDSSIVANYVSAGLKGLHMDSNLSPTTLASIRDDPPLSSTQQTCSQASLKMDRSDFKIEESHLDDVTLEVGSSLHMAGQLPENMARMLDAFEDSIFTPKASLKRTSIESSEAPSLFTPTRGFESNLGHVSSMTPAANSTSQNVDGPFIFGFKQPSPSPRASKPHSDASESVEKLDSPKAVALPQNSSIISYPFALRPRGNAEPNICALAEMIVAASADCNLREHS